MLNSLAILVVSALTPDRVVWALVLAWVIVLRCTPGKDCSLSQYQLLWIIGQTL